MSSSGMLKRPPRSVILTRLTFSMAYSHQRRRYVHAPPIMLPKNDFAAACWSPKTSACRTDHRAVGSGNNADGSAFRICSVPSSRHGATRAQGLRDSGRAGPVSVAASTSAVDDLPWPPSGLRLASASPCPAVAIVLAAFHRLRDCVYYRVRPPRFRSACNCRPSSASAPSANAPPVTDRGPSTYASTRMIAMIDATTTPHTPWPNGTLLS